MKRGLVLTTGIFLLLAGIMVFSGSVNAEGEITHCAEKTLDGAWCQNVPIEQVNGNFRSAPTSCESTSFCRLGTCVNSNEGTCSPNVPQRVCEEGNGVWVEGEPEEITQCRLGCCLVGDEAAFVTQTRCTSLSSDYGVESNYRSDIRNEIECIESANPREKGACVFDDGFQRDCRHLTRENCQAQEATSEGTAIEFHEGLLCSSESLATNCGPTERTVCVENADEVHFVDTCGNIANIYDSSKKNNQEYWSEMKDRDESCNPNSANAGSTSCGSCNYLLGSTCKAYERGSIQTPSRPQIGDFICADLSCRYDGESYEHGETWCGGSPGVDESLPGSEHHRLVCYNGDVTVEACSAFRQEVCLEDSIDDFKTAQCVVNRWQDCIIQDNELDCENADHRDCQWLEGQSLLRDDDGSTLVVNSNGELVQKDDDDDRGGATCLPLYAPGFDFWNAEGEAEELCALASEDCVVKFQKGLIGDWGCKENCECVGLEEGDKLDDIEEDNQWVRDRNKMCLALGDCGSGDNYAGHEGYHDADAVRISPLEEDD